MLLRVLPNTTPSQPSPPTILFTLPLPSHPYTSTSLPLPPTLMAHRSVCLQEDVECANVLLGEKSSWITGIIDAVTFSCPRNEVLISMIDGSNLTLPLTMASSECLRRVIHEVHLSFAPPSRPELIARASTSSIPSSTPATSTSTLRTRPSLTIPTQHRRSPSALLLSLLSPLLPVNQPQCIAQPVPNAQQSPPRLHRRQARSLLVDCYRRHVLPLLKDHLPEAYLPWAIASETNKRLDDLAALREEINTTLATAGIDQLAMDLSTPPRRSRSASSCSSASSDASSDASASPVTPATSIFSPSACSTPARAQRQSANPQSFLLSIPPPESLSSPHRKVYSAQVARLTLIASRLSSIQKLNATYEREEGKRRWLESLDRDRAGDKALRRAHSNGHIARGVRGMTTEPIKASRLWRSWTPEVEGRAGREAAQIVHPVMQDEHASEEISASEDESSSEASFDHESLPRPMEHLVSFTVGAIIDKVINVRPPLVHHDVPYSESEDDAPGLETSRHDHSLTESRDAAETPTEESVLLPAPLITMRWQSPPSPSRRNSKCLEVDWVGGSETEGESETFHHGTVLVYA